MGLRFLRYSLLLGFVISGLHAAPKLRLSSATVGPVQVAQGAAGQPQTIEAYNAGDGALALAATGSASWLAPSVGPARACTSRSGTCIPIQIGLSTASLAAGLYTEFVTVNDPNALDAPQTISVTVRAGTAVPDQLQFYLPPDGSSRSYAFMASNALSSKITTQDNRPWLSLALDPVGTFRFSYPYRIQVSHLPGMGEGTYNGTVAISGSTFAADNKNVAVTTRVTTQPVAQLAAERIRVTWAQNGPKGAANIVLTNSGQGNLTISGATATTASGGNWLTAGAPVGTVVPLTFDTTNVAPGDYQGTVTVNSNAANGNLTVPVELRVVAQGPPVASFGGVVNNATFKPGAVAPGDIVSLFGEQLTMSPLTPGTQVPLATQIAGTRVLVNGRAAPLYFSSYGQVAFQVPFETVPGEAEIRVERDGQRGNAVAVEVAARAPRILAVINQNGSSNSGGAASPPARIGEALVIYAIGLGVTSPAVASGAASPSAEPFARVTAPTVVTVGGGFMGTPVNIDPLFVGLTPGFVGLYQVNVILSEETPKGANIPLTVGVAGAFSNIVNVNIQ